MADVSENKILKKLNRIERLQKEIIKDWSLVEDFILELTAKRLKKEIRQGRKNYLSGEITPYRQLRAALKLV